MSKQSQFAIEFRSPVRPRAFEATFVAAALCVSQPELASAEQPRDPRGTAPSGASSPNEVEQPGESTHEEDATLETATPDPTPQVPRPFQRKGSRPTLDVVEQAGVGGPIAYASAGVLEVGGSGAVLASGDYLGAKFAPSAGWFIYDGVQVAYTHELYAGMRDSTDFFASMAVADVTLHLPIEDRLLWFFGAGPGIVYNDGHLGVGAKARAGFDVLIGRSGLLRPGTFFSVMSRPLLDLRGSSTNSRWQYGMEIAYAALF